MNELVTSALVMVSEFAAIFAIGFGFVGYKLYTRWKNDREQVKKFVVKLREKEPERNTQRIDVIKEKYNLDDEEIQAIIERILECEKSLYGKIIDIFLGKDKAKLDQLDGDVEALINSCYIQAKEGAADGGGDGIEIAVVSEEMDKLAKENVSLKAEKQKLENELQEMKTQSEEMMAEYVRMYGKEGEKERHSVEEEREKLKQGIQSNPALDKNKEEVLDAGDNVDDVDAMLDDVDFDSSEIIYGENDEEEKK